MATAHPTAPVASGIARVIVLGEQVASGEGILGGPPPNFYTDLDFWNGLEHNWGSTASGVSEDLK